MKWLTFARVCLCVSLFVSALCVGPALLFVESVKKKCIQRGVAYLCEDFVLAQIGEMVVSVTVSHTDTLEH